MNRRGLTASLLALLPFVLLCACHSQPACQKDPPFYLRGTQYDCAAIQRERSEGGKP